MQGCDHINYYCSYCGKHSDRVLIFDPFMQMNFDTKGNLVHKSCGIFITNRNGKVLLFRRTKFPFLLTIPAGHLGIGENPESAAIREAKEEVGIEINDMEEIFSGTVYGDACLGGADIHYWTAYRALLDDEAISISLDEEGKYWGWYEPDELSPENTVQPVLHILESLRR